MSALLLSSVRVCSLALFFVLWAVIGSGDWRRQKIARRSLVWGLGGAGLGYLLLIANTALGLLGKPGAFHLWPYYSAAGSFVGICVAAAMGLWLARIWPAGDAKLFICLALLFPLIDRSGSFNRAMTVLVILINTFIPPALYLFIRASYYIFDTRLRHGRDFLVQLGWKKELLYCWEKTREAASEALGEALRRLQALRRSPRELLAWAGAVLPLVLQWLFGMATMALVSYFLQDWIRSPLSLSLLCMGLFLLWSQLSRPLGAWASRLALGGVAAALFVLGPGLDWRRLGALFGNISVFSFFMFLGMNWAMRMMSGGWTVFAQILLPLCAMGVGWVLMSLWSFAASALRSIAAAIQGVHGPRAPAFGAAGQGLRGAASLAGNAFSAVYPWAGILLPLAAMGAFFGLSLSLVRKWDEEVRPRCHRDVLDPYSILAPEFIELLRLDPAFFEEHFQTLYADGITRDQAEALKVWCREQGIEFVPLTPTISFASWIFLGFMLSSLLQGSHVLEALL